MDGSLTELVPCCDAREPLRDESRLTLPVRIRRATDIRSKDTDRCCVVSCRLFTVGGGTAGSRFDFASACCWRYSLRKASTTGSFFQRRVGKAHSFRNSAIFTYTVLVYKFYLKIL